MRKSLIRWHCSSYCVGLIFFILSRDLYKIGADNGTWTLQILLNRSFVARNVVMAALRNLNHSIRSFGAIVLLPQSKTLE